jgi:hypothetical protein
LDSWRGQFALTATLSFQFALNANLWFKPAVEAWNGCIDMKRFIREQLPTYGSKRCHFMAQVSGFDWTRNVAASATLSGPILNLLAFSHLFLLA